MTGALALHQLEHLGERRDARAVHPALCGKVAA